MNHARARELLLALTALPTASGREDAVADFVRRWAARRKGLRLREDPAGNLWLEAKQEPAGAAPVVVVAHMDHPAAVVASESEPSPETGFAVEADFLGGVRADHMAGAAMRLHRRRGGPSAKGRVVAVEEAGGAKARAAARPGRPQPGERGDPRLSVGFRRDPGARPGDILTWDLGGSVVRGGLLHAPACDNLAGVSAALVAINAASAGAARGKGSGVAPVPLRVLLTRAEEVGFVGAIAACVAGDFPRDARVVVLECSKASPEAPIGAGPVVRVGDRTSTFDPGLLADLARVAAELEADRRRAFRWQRRLMVGGTCEATAFAAFGFAAACVCLPLGNYHNMSDARPGELARETISLEDFEGLCTLLRALPARLASGGGSLVERLRAIHGRRAGLLRPMRG